MMKKLMAVLLTLSLLVPLAASAEEAVADSVGDPIDDSWYFGLSAGTTFEEVFGGSEDFILSGSVAYVLPEGIWLEWEPSEADSAGSVTYIKAGYELYRDGVRLYVGPQLIDKANYGAWAGALIPIKEQRYARLALEYSEGGGTAVKLGYFISGGMY